MFIIIGNVATLWERRRHAHSNPRSGRRLHPGHNLVAFGAVGLIAAFVLVSFLRPLLPQVDRTDTVMITPIQGFLGVPGEQAPYLVVIDDPAGKSYYFEYGNTRGAVSANERGQVVSVQEDPDPLMQAVVQVTSHQCDAPWNSAILCPNHNYGYVFRIPEGRVLYLTPEQAALNRAPPNIVK